ncbi:MAG: ATP-binding cassette domain-containing protein [Deltaproteobacteria bacterium]|nr:ATP-binding cassette domain-containing protein [Deltaproteobacteria bacterium]
MAEAFLHVRDLACVINGRHVLRGLDLDVREGEIHALIGANGSGKSTLAFILMGCDGYAATAGVTRFKGTDLAPLAIHERARLGMTLAWQQPAQFEGITVREYLGLRRSGVDPAWALAQVGLDPGRCLDRSVDRTLSGGERQRIELASVLAMKPDLAILDEPTAGIDLLSMAQILAIIRALRDGGGAVLLITHQEEVALAADRASVLDDGRIRHTGPPQDTVAHFLARGGEHGVA